MKNWIELNAQRGIKKTRKGPGNERKTNTGYNMYAKKKKKERSVSEDIDERNAIESSIHLSIAYFPSIRFIGSIGY